MFGIDFSHHNIATCSCVPDWAALARQQVRFAYFKASQGTDFRDSSFKKLVDSVGAQGATGTIKLGAYHFLTSNASAADQAEHFIATLSDLPANDLPPALDLEWDVAIGADGEVVRDQNGKPIDGWAEQTPDSIISRAKIWLDLVEAKTGQAPIIYTNVVWWRERIGQSVPPALTNRSFWLAQYAPTAAGEPETLPGSQWLLWQFTNSARFVQGAMPPSTNVDASVFNSGSEQFQKSFNQP